MDVRRFRDPMLQIHDLAAETVDVVCPRCEEQAACVPQPTELRRLVCPGCGLAPARTSGSTRWGGPVDPFFGLPLWLRAGCCGGHVLWAYNRTHLDLLERHVAVDLRERGDRPGHTVLTRLPAWITAAKHRDEVLRTIRRLRGTLRA
jgi:hypothetical protein